MVDPAQLSYDILANAAALSVPGLLWAFLYLVAWEDGPFSESLGLGRRAFWLLLPGAVLASFAVLPFALISNDVLAVSFGGAVFPLLVGLLAVRRYTGRARAFLGRLFVLIAVESGVGLFLVLPVSAPLAEGLARALGGDVAAATTLLVLPIAVLVPAVAYGLYGRPPAGSPGTVADGPALAFLLVLLSGVLYTTFAASSAIPGVGITEPFPFYLLPPIGAGVLAAFFAPRVFPGREGFALPLVYLATTVGVLIGADLLRQPPLYGNGPPGLYSIGGAGVLDLVYLSGLLALASAYATHRLLGHSRAPLGTAAPAFGVSPGAQLARAFRAGVDGHLPESLDASARAARSAADRTRLLLDVPPAPPDRPWEGLKVPGWVVSDQASLDAIARTPTADGREGFRAWLTARALVRGAEVMADGRFGTLRLRTLGFLLDLAIVGVPALAIWAGIVLATPGDLSDVLSSLAFNGAIYGFIALAFLYRAVSEAWTGTSPGKRVFHLEVRDRTLGRIGLLTALVRNASILPVLTVLGLGGALVVAFGAKWGTFGSVTVDGIALPGAAFALAGVVAFVVAGVALLGTFGALVIHLSADRQRVGDRWAGTWVVRDRPPTGPVPRTPPVPPPPATPASGAGPSG